jgi:RimJ/RimL family protein N-acetyltransferase
MQTNYKTERLLLRTLSNADAPFIFELLNTEGWIKFIGDRNISNLEDAAQYIQKILNNPAVEYRVVTLKNEQTPTGIISFIKRDYLEHYDIGFAFLPAYAGQGYAFEAANAVLADMLKSGEHKTILATTFKDNLTSIRLLEKLGFVFSKQITNEELTLQLYALENRKANAVFLRTDSDNADFQNLVALLDADLAIRDGAEHAFYAQFNKTTAIRNAIVCYVDDEAVGCGAFKKYDDEKAEIKRMFVLPQYRGQGIGLGILKELEVWAAENNYAACILETGKKQPEAIHLYRKAGYSITPNYGQYEGVENSVCMMKKVS